LGIARTAGSVLSESQLRALLSCSEYYSLGGTVKENWWTPVLAHMVAYPVLDPSVSLGDITSVSSPLYKQSKKLLTRIDKERKVFSTHFARTQFHHAVITQFSNLYRGLDMYKSKPVLGPTKLRIRLSKTPVDFEIQGALATTSLFQGEPRDKYTFVKVSEAITASHARRDPLMFKTAEAVHSLLGHTTSANLIHPDSCLYYLGLQTKLKTFPKNPLYFKLYFHRIPLGSLDEHKSLHIENIVKTYEQDGNFPAYPCPIRNCKYRKECYAF
jgi:hypothetical protein